jgi:hypothetical protein
MTCVTYRGDEKYINTHTTEDIKLNGGHERKTYTNKTIFSTPSMSP